MTSPDTAVNEVRTTVSDEEISELLAFEGDLALHAAVDPFKMRALLTELQHRREAEAEPFCYVREWPASFDPQTGSEPASIDFSDVPKPGYEPLFKVAASPASGVRVTEAMLDKALIALHENDPAWKKRYDATAIRLRTEDMTRALIAALGEHP